MYKSHTVLDLNLIYIFEFELKHSLTSFNIFFFVIKTHIINLIYIVLIKIRLNIFMCFLFSTYFIIFLQEKWIHCFFNNSIVLFLPVKYISVLRIVSAVIIMPNFSILRDKVSQDLVFIWWIHSTMYGACGFGSILWIIYAYFTALSSDLTFIE